MKLFIIMKDREPYNPSNMKKDTFVKAYYDEKIAIKTAKAFCTSEASLYYRYGEGYYKNEYLNSKERDELAKKLSEENFPKHWSIKGIEI